MHPLKQLDQGLSTPAPPLSLHSQSSPCAHAWTRRHLGHSPGLGRPCLFGGSFHFKNAWSDSRLVRNTNTDSYHLANNFVTTLHSSISSSASKISVSVPYTHPATKQLLKGDFYLELVSQDNINVVARAPSTATTFITVVGEKGCDTHDVCNNLEYCDLQRTCYTCYGCDELADAIDGRCPTKCRFKTGECPARGGGCRR